MEVESAEIKAFDLLHGTRLLKRRWKLVFATALAGALIALAATLFVPPIWESEVDIQLGSVDREGLEDVEVLMRILESDAVVQSFPSSDDGVRQPVRAQIVEAKPGGPIAYVRVIARGRTADTARSRATQALEFAKRRHAALAETLVSQSQEYGDRLALTVDQLKDSISTLERIVATLRLNQESMLVAVLLQTELEAKRSQYVLLSKELGDWRLKHARGTNETRELAPPSTPQHPIWPSRLVFAVVGGSLGLALGAVGALRLE